MQEISLLWCLMFDHRVPYVEFNLLRKGDGEGNVNSYRGCQAQIGGLQRKWDFSNLNRTLFFGGGKQRFWSRLLQGNWVSSYTCITFSLCLASALVLNWSRKQGVGKSKQQISFYAAETLLLDSLICSSIENMIKILLCMDTNYGIGLMGWMSERKSGGAVGHVEILSDTLSKHCIFNVEGAWV